MTDIFLNDDNDKMKLKFFIRFYYFLDLKFKKLKRDLTYNDDSSYSEKNIQDMVKSYLKNYKEDVLGKSVADYFLKPYLDYFCNGNYSDKGCDSYYEFFNNIQSEGELNSDNLIKNIREALKEKIDNIKTQSEAYHLNESLKSAVKKLLDSVKLEKGGDIEKNKQKLEKNKQELEKFINDLVEEQRNKISTEKTTSDRLYDRLSESQATELEADIFNLKTNIASQEEIIEEKEKELEEGRITNPKDREIKEAELKELKLKLTQEKNKMDENKNKLRELKQEKHIKKQNIIEKSDIIKKLNNIIDLINELNKLNKVMYQQQSNDEKSKLDNILQKLSSNKLDTSKKPSIEDIANIPDIPKINVRTIYDLKNRDFIDPPFYHIISKPDIYNEIYPTNKEQAKLYKKYEKSKEILKLLSRQVKNDISITDFIQEIKEKDNKKKKPDKLFDNEEINEKELKLFLEKIISIKKSIPPSKMSGGADPLAIPIAALSSGIFNLGGGVISISLFTAIFASTAAAVLIGSLAYYLIRTANTNSKITDEFISEKFKEMRDKIHEINEAKKNQVMVSVTNQNNLVTAPLEAELARLKQEVMEKGSVEQATSEAVEKAKAELEYAKNKATGEIDQAVKDLQTMVEKMKETLEQASKEREAAETAENNANEKALKAKSEEEAEEKIIHTLAELNKLEDTDTLKKYNNIIKSYESTLFSNIETKLLENLTKPEDEGAENEVEGGLEAERVPEEEAARERAMKVMSMASNERGEDRLQDGVREPSKDKPSRN